MLSMDTTCPVAQQWYPIAGGLCRFVCSLCVAAVVVTRDVIDGSTLVFFRYFVFRVYYHRMAGVSRLMVHAHVV